MLTDVGVVDGLGWVKARTRHLEAELEKASTDEERGHIQAECYQTLCQFSGSGGQIQHFLRREGTPGKSPAQCFGRVVGSVLGVISGSGTEGLRTMDKEGLFRFRHLLVHVCHGNP